MRDASVELVGDFDSDEASFLRRQFDDCRIELTARSLLDGRTALLRWQPLADVGARSLETCAPSVTDRRRRPPVAWYILEHQPHLHLTPIAAGPDLRKRYPGHFPTDAVPERPARKGCLPFGGLFVAVPFALAIRVARTLR